MQEYLISEANNFASGRIELPGNQLFFTGSDNIVYECDYYLLNCNPNGTGIGMITGDNRDDIFILDQIMKGLTGLSNFPGTTIKVGDGQACDNSQCN